MNPKKKVSTIWEWYESTRYVLVCLVTLALLILDNVIENNWPRYTMTLILVVFISSQISPLIFRNPRDKRKRNIFTLVLSLLVLILEFHLLYFMENDDGISLFFIGLFALGVASMVSRLFRSDEVDLNTVFAGILGYILLAVLAMAVYVYIDNNAENAFAFMGQPHVFSRGPQPLYFSLVTITTLGYGDFVPLTDQARLAAGLSAVIGQLYMAIVIARLVALYMREKSDKERLAQVKQAVKQAMSEWHREHDKRLAKASKPHPPGNP